MGINTRGDKQIVIKDHGVLISFFTSPENEIPYNGVELTQGQGKS